MPVNSVHLVISLTVQQRSGPRYTDQYWWLSLWPIYPETGQLTHSRGHHRLVLPSERCHNPTKPNQANSQDRTRGRYPNRWSVWFPDLTSAATGGEIKSETKIWSTAHPFGQTRNRWHRLNISLGCFMLFQGRLKQNNSSAKGRFTGTFHLGSQLPAVTRL